MKTVTFLTLLAVLQSYRLAAPGFVHEFPRDHGNHPEFRLEWWYFTGHLQTAQNRRFGYELTFFRYGIEPHPESRSSWAVGDLYPVHLAMTDPDNGRFQFSQKLCRTGPGLAGAREGTLHVWCGGWSARLDGELIRLKAASPEFGIDLQLKALKGPVIHGVDGLSQKGSAPGAASHYYSLTRLSTSGSLRAGSSDFEVQGESWMDHEFGTSQLGRDQVGWDWFSLQLENGVELMLFELRKADGSIDANSSGTIVLADGSSVHLTREGFEVQSEKTWVSPDTSIAYPSEWKVTIPADGSTLRITPILPNQELDTRGSTGIIYWEGAVEVSGQWRGHPVQGRGYVELTGYGKGGRPKV